MYIPRGVHVPTVIRVRNARDGMLYMLALEIQVLPHCQPPTGPAKKTATGDIYYEEGCVIVALLIRQADMTDTENSGQIWANVGENAANLHVISDALWATRDVRAQQQIDFRASTPPTRPDNKSDLVTTTWDIVLKCFRRMAAPPAPVSPPSVQHAAAGAFAGSVLHAA